MVTYGVKLQRSTPLALPRHPDAPAEGDFQTWCEMQRASGRPLAVDLFSGAGGLGAGVEAAGWTVAVAVDHDSAAIETHRGNFPGRAMNVDMSIPDEVKSLIEMLQPLQIDLVAGGPPCQPFSRAGRSKIRSLVAEGVRDEIDTRRELWRSFIEVVLALKPRAVLLENVPDMALSDDLLVIREIAGILERNGYDVDYRLLDAWRHGVPQHRKRFILQARRDERQISWPLHSESVPTVRDAIADLPALGDSVGSRTMPYHATPSSSLAKRSRRGMEGDVIHDHMTRPVREDDREAFSLMTSETLYSDLPEHLRRYRSDTFNDKYKRLPWDDLSRTITAHIAKDGYWYIHPAEHRTLSVREAARIQTFPDSFRFAGTRSDAFRQIGNAVPPLLGKAVATGIFPGQGPSSSVQPIIELREKLSGFAFADREDYWWFYPGPGMTPICAVVAALFEAHRLPKPAAAELMSNFRGAERLTSTDLQKLLTYATSSTRARTLRDLRTQVRRFAKPGDLLDALLLGMTQSQRAVFKLLTNQNELLLNSGVARAVTKILNLPQSGLLTDIKVGLAQLVSSDDLSPLRMAALRRIGSADATTLKETVEQLLQANSRREAE